MAVTAEKPNAYRDANRAAKIEAVVLVLDASLDAMGVDPHSQQAATLVENLSDQKWLRAAIAAKKNEPSDIAKEQIRELYRKRAKASGR